MPFSHFTLKPPASRIIGHRGVAALAPENTMASFRLAARQGVEWIEFDLRLTKDHALVIFHDDILDRTSNGFGLIEEKLLSELETLDAGSWFSATYSGEKIPVFTEVIKELYNLDLFFNVELKLSANPTVTQIEKLAAKTIETLQQHNSDRPLPLISSFHWPLLNQIRKLAPAYPLGFLCEEPNLAQIQEVKDMKNVAFHCNYLHLTTEILTHAKQADLPLLVYTVNNAVLAKSLLNQGVFAVFSDDPKQLLQDMADTKI